DDRQTRLACPLDGGSDVVALEITERADSTRLAVTARVIGEDVEALFLQRGRHRDQLGVVLGGREPMDEHDGAAGVGGGPGADGKLDAIAGGQDGHAAPHISAATGSLDGGGRYDRNVV